MYHMESINPQIIAMKTLYILHQRFYNGQQLYVMIIDLC